MSRPKWVGSKSDGRKTRNSSEISYWVNIMGMLDGDNPYYSIKYSIQHYEPDGYSCPTMDIIL